MAVGAELSRKSREEILLFPEAGQSSTEVLPLKKKERFKLGNLALTKACEGSPYPHEVVRRSRPSQTDRSADLAAVKGQLSQLQDNSE